MQAWKKLIAPVACLFALLASSSAAGYAQITVFGDSLADAGNVFALTAGTVPPLTGGPFPPSPPYAQRLSNGPVAVEVLAANLGLPLTPSLKGGRDFAFGGADTGVGNYFSVYPGVPTEINTLFSGPLQTGTLAQVQSFIVNGNTIAPDGLTVLWAGPNDIFTALTLGQNPADFIPDVIQPAIDNLSLEVIMLYGAGARTILLPGMADLGRTPFGLTSGFSAGLTQLSGIFNFGLDQAIDQLELLLPGLNIIEFDTFSFVDAAIANPGAFGFTNVSDPCFNGITVCLNPDQYIFWDTVHPTARAHLLLGNAFTAAVPEPTTVALTAIGLAFLGFARRRR